MKRTLKIVTIILFGLMAQKQTINAQTSKNTSDIKEMKNRFILFYNSSFVPDVNFVTAVANNLEFLDSSKMENYEIDSPITSRFWLPKPYTWRNLMMKVMNSVQKDVLVTESNFASEIATCKKMLWDNNFSVKTRNYCITSDGSVGYAENYVGTGRWVMVYKGHIVMIFECFNPNLPETTKVASGDDVIKMPAKKSSAPVITNTGIDMSYMATYKSPEKPKDSVPNNNCTCGKCNTQSRDYNQNNCTCGKCNQQQEPFCSSAINHNHWNICPNDLRDVNPKPGSLWYADYTGYEIYYNSSRGYLFYPKGYSVGQMIGWILVDALTARILPRPYYYPSYGYNQPYFSGYYGDYRNYGGAWYGPNYNYQNHQFGHGGRNNGGIYRPRR